MSGNRIAKAEEKGNGDMLAQAADTLFRVEQDIFDLVSIFAVVCDAVCRPDECDGELAIPFERRRGFSALYGLIEEHYNKTASDVAGVTNMLAKMQGNIKVEE